MTGNNHSAVLDDAPRGLKQKETAVERIARRSDPEQLRLLREEDAKRRASLYAPRKIEAKAKPCNVVPFHSKPKTESLFPDWPENFRSLPNELLRCALFTCVNKKVPRRYRNGEHLPFPGQKEKARIVVTGMELRQDDATVWFQLVHMAKDIPPGEPVRFAPVDFCKLLGWPVSGPNYTRIQDCIRRMQATSLIVILPDETTGKIRNFSGKSMIPEFSYLAEDGERKLPIYEVTIAKGIDSLFADSLYTSILWSQRLQLQEGFVTWLHSYYASHSKPWPVKVENIAKYAGLKTDQEAKYLNLAVREALNKLVEVGFLESFSVKKGLVSVVRT